MDVPEDERDVQLQRTSADLLADLEASLSPFLWRTGKSGKLGLRRRVSSRQVERLVALLEPFQELPQLLDPHLDRLVPELAKALVASLGLAPAVARGGAEKALVPLPTAISKLLYVFCKIRGEKVIVRFFGAEVKYLEVLLLAMEGAETARIEGEASTDLAIAPWSWEQRYICLLWMSHLLLAPFDLATLSSRRATDDAPAVIPGLTWPPRMPAIPVRVVPLALRYISSSGKERESATVLLVRIALRKDMQELGLLQALIEWALSSLQSISMMTANSIYFYIGILSFLASLLVSSMNTSDMDSHLLKIFRSVQSISSEDDIAFKAIQSSAVARKTVIKVLRAAAVLVLRDQSSAVEVETTEVVETAISHLLEALGDNDTPVRLAASKSLSVITLRLPPSMAAEVVEALLASLSQNVLWKDNSHRGDNLQSGDLSAVNPLEWHGLMMTLSHLLYRRSPPQESLPDIIRCLMVGLIFEQRSTSGGSIGGNVRDAACFGFWALARQYNTLELQSVRLGGAKAPSKAAHTLSTIQVLATELVAAACFDPVGNIRRGASAALQELIGRHPDVVAEGISIVQIVDYHAVAFRSRAVLEVSTNSAKLSHLYGEALVSAVLGWRGVGDPDPASRRTASFGIGKMARNFQTMGDARPWNIASSLVLRIEQQLHTTKLRDIDQRHGLLLSMAAVLSAMSDILSASSIVSEASSIPDMLKSITLVLQSFSSVLQDTQLSSRRPEFIAEGGSSLIAAACPLIRRAYVLKELAGSSQDLSNSLEKSLKEVFVLLKNPNLLVEKDIADAKDLMRVLDFSNIAESSTLSDLLQRMKEMLDVWLLQSEKDAMDAAVEAAASLTLLMDCSSRTDTIGWWLEKAQSEHTFGHLYALAAIFPVASKDQQQKISNEILGRWKTAANIETRIQLLQCIARSTFLASHATLFMDMMTDGLDDYTTDSRGDVGSLVRVEALKALGTVFGAIRSFNLAAGSEGHAAYPYFTTPEQIGSLYGKTLRLAAEKLDRVRIEAQRCLTVLISNSEGQKRFRNCSISSYEYFQWLLNIQMHDCFGLSFMQHRPGIWITEFLEGFVTSADTGSEGLVKASRAVLVDFCEGADRRSMDVTEAERVNLVCNALFLLMKRQIANDRVLVSTMEAVGFLFDAGILQRSGLEWRALYLLVQKAHYKTSNVRKLEAAIKLYGHLIDFCPEALPKLISMLLHPFPSIRSRVADTLFVTRGIATGVNWHKARQSDLARLRESIAIGR